MFSNLVEGAKVMNFKNIANKAISFYANLYKKDTIKRPRIDILFYNHFPSDLGLCLLFFIISFQRSFVIVKSLWKVKGKVRDFKSKITNMTKRNKKAEIMGKHDTRYGSSLMKQIQKNES